jgi:hypothetical protein
MAHLTLGPPASAATDRDDDFQAVAAGKSGVGMLAAGDDFAVFFDGNAFSGKVQRLDQLAQGERGGKAAGFAVNDKFNHKSRLLSEECKFQYHVEFYPEAPMQGMKAITARASYSGIT